MQWARRRWPYFTTCAVRRARRNALSLSASEIAYRVAHVSHFCWRLRCLFLSGQRAGFSHSFTSEARHTPFDFIAHTCASTARSGALDTREPWAHREKRCVYVRSSVAIDMPPFGDLSPESSPRTHGGVLSQLQQSSTPRIKRQSPVLARPRLRVRGPLAEIFVASRGLGQRSYRAQARTRKRRRPALLTGNRPFSKHRFVELFK